LNEPTPISHSFETFNPHGYLSEYYSDIGTENEALMKFFADVYQGFADDSLRIIEIGGGPTLYQLISATPCAKEIHFSDYLASNLDEVNNYLLGHEDAFNWDSFVLRALELESGQAPSQAAVDQRKLAIRKKITRTFPCNVFTLPPIDEGSSSYDVVSTNFVAESVTSKYVQWRAALGNITSLLKPDGLLIMSGLLEANYWIIGSRRFPATNLNEKIVNETLIDLGFKIKDFRIIDSESEHDVNDKEEYQGYKGMFFVEAEKQ
jgi:hypothetical protein